MKMLPKEYSKAVGEPFRVESYKGAKLEMYFLDDRPDYSKFASRGRFSVWTSDGVNYRLFVDKGYYHAVNLLYQNGVNDIWLDFTNSIYAAQKKMSTTYMLFSFIILAVVLGASYLIQALWPEQANNVFLVSMVVLFVGLFYSSGRQQKRLKALVDVENKKATELIRDEVGADGFQSILDAQELYYQQYFKVEEDTEETTEADATDAGQIENNEEKLDDESTSSDDSKERKDE